MKNFISELALRATLQLFIHDERVYKAFDPGHEVEEIKKYGFGELSLSKNESVRASARDLMLFLLKYNEYLDYESFSNNPEVGRKLRKHIDAK